MRNKATIGFVLLLTLLITPLMSGCQSIRNIFGGVTDEDGNSNQGYSIYYISTSENSLGAFPHKLKATKEMDIINECLDALRQEPSDSSFRAVLGDEIDVLKTEYSETEKTLGLYLPREYKELSKSAEILERAAIVKTLTQFGGIVNYVSFCVDDEWIKDSDGSILKMSDGDYVSKINLFFFFFF